MENKAEDVKSPEDVSSNIKQSESQPKTTDIASSQPTQPIAPAPVESFPDPDEDDLDDLDGKTTHPLIWCSPTNKRSQTC